MPRERDGPREGDLDGRERQRDEEGVATWKQGDCEMRMRNIRRGRGDKGERRKRSVKQTRQRETERRGSNPRGFEKRRLRRRGGWTRGARTHRLKNLDLYLDLRKERVVRHVSESREGPEGADGLAGMANAYGSSPEVRECKFYDQSGGLIRRRCATALSAARKRKRCPLAEIFGLAKQ